MIYASVGRKNSFPGTSNMKYLVTVIFLAYLVFMLIIIYKKN